MIHLVELTGYTDAATSAVYRYATAGYVTGRPPRCMTGECELQAGRRVDVAVLGDRLEAALAQVALQGRRTAERLAKFDEDGMPEVRA